MWYVIENGEDVRPTEVDDTSSRVYVYVRRNIRRIEGDGDQILTHYAWDEMAVPRDLWETWERVETHDDAIVEVADLAAGNGEAVEMLTQAIIELAEIIGGGE